jgi:hypothetical protein
MISLDIGSLITKEREQTMKFRGLFEDGINMLLNGQGINISAGNSSTGA